MVSATLERCGERQFNEGPTQQEGLDEEARHESDAKILRCRLNCEDSVVKLDDMPCGRFVDAGVFQLFGPQIRSRTHGDARCRKQIGRYPPLLVSTKAWAADQCGMFAHECTAGQAGKM